MALVPFGVMTIEQITARGSLTSRLRDNLLTKIVTITIRDNTVDTFKFINSSSSSSNVFRLNVPRLPSIQETHHVCLQCLKRHIRAGHVRIQLKPA